MKALTTLIALVGAAMSMTAANAQTLFAPGNSQASVVLTGTTLNVFTYKPTTCTPRQLLVVFHGLNRDAGPYRDHARTLADRLCAVVVSPEFDAARFPTMLYQMGGSTVGLVAPLVDWARKTAGQPDMPYMLIGHSAGGQFLSRVAAYTTPAAARIVIANPSSWVLPDTSAATPFGFGGVANAEQALRAYLALPVVVLLGLDDTGTHNLSSTKDASAQGPNRLMRGRNTFEKARAAAQRHGWPFNWTLVEVPGVGHDAAKMFSAPLTIAALAE
jgi:hypothetical protein